MATTAMDYENAAGERFEGQSPACVVIRLRGFRVAVAFAF